MKNHSIVCLFILLVIATQHTIQNLPNGFEPRDELEYVNYLNIMLGNHKQFSDLSQSLQIMLNNERPSLLNAPSKLVLLLTSLPVSSEIKEQVLPLFGHHIKSFLQKYDGNVEIYNLEKATEAEIKEKIDQFSAQGALVNLIAGEKSQINKLNEKIQRKETGSKRLLQAKASTNDSTYLIKFFFSLLFVFVIVACVGFISANDGKKDTLLYAKFIADVGSR